MHLGTLCVGVTAPDVEITIVRSIGLANHPEDGRVRPDDRGGRCLVLQNIKSSAAILTGIMHEPGGVFVFFFCRYGHRMYLIRGSRADGMCRTPFSENGF